MMFYLDTEIRLLETLFWQSHCLYLIKGFDIEVEITIHALSLNLKICECDINYFERPEGSISKLSTFKDGFLHNKNYF